MTQEGRTLRYYFLRHAHTRCPGRIFIDCPLCIIFSGTYSISDDFAIYGTVNVSKQSYSIIKIFCIGTSITPGEFDLQKGMDGRKNELHSNLGGGHDSDFLQCYPPSPFPSDSGPPSVCQASQRRFYLAPTYTVTLLDRSPISNDDLTK